MNALLNSTTLQLLGTIGAIWLSWRIWRFAIRPRFRPNEPKEYPYWSPFVGHFAAFFQNNNALIAKGRKYFAVTGEPFIITVFGDAIYVPTSPDDVNNGWNKSQTISLRPFLVDMYTLMGISDKSKEELVIVHENAKYNEGMGKSLNSTEMVNELHRQALRNGPNGSRLDEMMSNGTIPAMSKRLEFKQEVGSHDSFTISLSKLCDVVFIGIGTDTWFGPKLREVEPDVVPHIFAKEILSAKETLIDALNRYYKTPRHERADGRYFVTALEDMLREVGLTDSELGKFLLPHNWAIFANVYKIGFRSVAHLVHDSSLLQRIREGLTPAVQGENVDETYLQDQCPKLQSLIDETLHLTVHTSLVRGVMEPTVIAKPFRPGHKVMLPISELHLNEGAWGKNPNNFVANRFLDNPKLTKSMAFRPGAEVRQYVQKASLQKRPSAPSLRDWFRDMSRRSNRRPFRQRMARGRPLARF